MKPEPEPLAYMQEVSMAFHDFKWISMFFFIVPGQFFMVPGRFFMVPGRFLWLFMVPGFFHGYRSFLWVFNIPGQFL